MLTAIFAKTNLGASGGRAFLLVFIMAIIFFFNYFAPGQVISSFWDNYVIPALLWGVIALIILRLPVTNSAAKRRWKSFFNWMALASALAVILAGYGVGLLEGFGTSPYDLSPRGMAINFFYLGFLVAGMELSRAWFLSVFFRRRPIAGIAFLSFIYSFFWFSMNRVTIFEDGLEMVRFAGSIFLPALSESVLTTYLAFWGGALPAIIYRCTLLAVRWFFPVLPDLNWFTLSLIGTFVPFFGLIITHQLFMGESNRTRRSRGEGGSSLGWLVTSVVSVLVIWFSVGVFSYFPTAIVSGSMMPEIAIGDVVIVKRVAAAEVELGDVIQFRDGNLRIAHRVVEIGEDAEGRRIMWTKGDANRNRDTDPVLPEQVIGTVVYKIPKAGWITLWVQSFGS